MKITPQAVQYGLPSKEAREIPAAADLGDLLSGHGITPGLMSRRASESSWDEEE